jgi:hypothetical protein
VGLPPNLFRALEISTTCIGRAGHLYLICKYALRRLLQEAVQLAVDLCGGLRTIQPIIQSMESDLVKARTEMARIGADVELQVVFWGRYSTSAHMALVRASQRVIEELLLAIDATEFSLTQFSHPRIYTDPALGFEPDRIPSHIAAVGAHFAARVTMPDPDRILMEARNEALALAGLRAAVPAGQGTVPLPAGDLPPNQSSGSPSSAASTGASVLQADLPPPVLPDTEERAQDTEQYVTLRQIAAMVNRKKKSLENYKTRKEDPLPAPTIEGGGGRAAEWKWQDIRPWLERVFRRQLPERFPLIG